MSAFGERIRPHVSAALRLAAAAEARGDLPGAFAHLERAHVIGQASTREHVRVHLQMLRWGVRRRAVREVLGQIFRIAGAATMTGIGLVPAGNTGGTDVSPFKRMPIPHELQTLIGAAERGDGFTDTR